eukprot:COSAG01_NODE_66271_length_270_cov_1.777778_1_plen_42_part_01
MLAQCLQALESLVGRARPASRGAGKHSRDGGLLANTLQRNKT